MVLVSAPGQVGAPQSTVTPAQVSQMPLVDFAPGWAIRQEVDRAFRAAGVERNTVFEVNDIVAAAELVRHGLGVCVMPASIAARFGDLEVHRFAQHAPSWKVMVVRPRGEPTPAVAALMRHIV